MASLSTFLSKQGVNLPVQLDCETESRKLAPLSFKYGDGRSIEFLSGNTIYLERYFPNSAQEAVLTGLLPCRAASSAGHQRVTD